MARDGAARRRRAVTHPFSAWAIHAAALLFWWTRKRIGEEEALVTAIAYLAMPLTVAFARIVIFDSALSLFVVFAIIAFYEAVETKDKRWTVAAWAAIALGVLTKGPVAIALPLLTAIPFAVWRKGFRMLWSTLGLVVFVAIIAPWVWVIRHQRLLRQLDVHDQRLRNYVAAPLVAGGLTFLFGLRLIIAGS